MAIYSPFAYLPQSLGIFAMSLFSAKILLLFLTGRVFNLILYTILCFYAIKSTPFLKWAFVIVLSSPMCIALAVSLSADAVLIGFCSIFLAKVLQYSFNEQPYLSKKQLLLLSVLALMIAMIKQSFFFAVYIFNPRKQIQKKLYFYDCFNFDSCSDFFRHVVAICLVNYGFT